uniref:Cyclin-dependent kinase 4 inhibitor C isoform X1 n=1 Tax=Geotrypetes seraphini TaxID=260995 RepID=A0A6P8NQ66_GEOSA|nr:cyclin-dependent kinase 4 inhibitor C isoform X1 [Geotrypetes seraphini]
MVLLVTAKRRVFKKKRRFFYFVVLRGKQLFAKRDKKAVNESRGGKVKPGWHSCCARAAPEPRVMKLGNTGIARRLLYKGADPNLKDRTGFAVIHDAARAGFLDTVKTLLQFQADVNIEDNEGNLPLHLAAQEGHLGVVEFLVRHTESNVGHINHKGATAHDLAKMYKKEEVVKWMNDNAHVQATNLQ